MLHALADGETKPAALAALANKQLRATSEQLCDALGACTELNPVYRRLLKMALQELQFIEQHIGQLDQEMASLLSQHQDAVQRLAEVPGLGVDSAQQIIAEVGATAASFPSDKHLSSWVGAVLETKKARECPRATAPPRAIVRCAAFSINVPTPRSRSKGAFFRSYIVGWYPGWDTIKPLGRLRIGYADSSGSFCIAGFVIRNTAQPSKKVRNEHARRE